MTMILTRLMVVPRAEKPNYLGGNSILADGQCQQVLGALSLWITLLKFDARLTP
jgi:hypothetical protein